MRRLIAVLVGGGLAAVLAVAAISALAPGSASAPSRCALSHPSDGAPTVAPTPTPASTPGYALVRPAGWDAGTSLGAPLLCGSHGETVTVLAYPTGGDTLEILTAANLRALKQVDRATVDEDVEATLGGEPARRITYHFVDSTDAKAFGIDLVAIHGALEVTVGWQSPAGHEAADSAAFGLVTASFTFSP